MKKPPLSAIYGCVLSITGADVDLGKRKKNMQTCQRSEGCDIKKNLKMNPFAPSLSHTHICEHSHPLPATQSSLPPFSWVLEWEIKFFWWESFSCPHSSPPILSSHPFFNLFTYLWTINLFTEREINSCAVECSGCCRVRDERSSATDRPRSHTRANTNMTPRSRSKQEEGRRCISAGAAVTVHQLCVGSSEVSFGFNCCF